jgi:NitT/TauT family transport system substrate-binding protein
MRRSFLGLAAATLTIAGLTACGGDSSESSTTASASGSGEVPVLRLGISSYTGYGPYFIGQKKGYFKDAGVDLQPTIVGDDALQRGVAVRSGKLEGFATTLDTVINTMGKGVPVVNVMATDTSDGADGIVGKRDFGSIADLRGQEVAVQSGTTTEFLLAYALKQNGLTLDDIKVRQLDPSAAGSAFVSGKVPAAATWQPWLDQAAKSGGKILASTKDYPGVLVDTIALDREWANDNPDAVRAAIEGWDKSVAFLEANPEESLEIMSEGLDTKVADLKDQLTSITFYTSDDARTLFGTVDAPGPLYKVAEEAAAFWKASGDAPEPVSAQDALDPQFLNDAGN